MEEIGCSALRNSADSEVLTGTRAGLVNLETRAPGCGPRSGPLSMAELAIPQDPTSASALPLASVYHEVIPHLLL